MSNKFPLKQYKRLNSGDIHLTDDLVERFRLRRMTSIDLDKAQAHIASCLSCNERLGGVMNFNRMFDSLLIGIEEARDEPSHLEVQIISDYIAGSLGEADRQIAERHFESCRMCLSDLAELRVAKEESLSGFI